jgi:DNA polymerase elongation subunit (family B)
MNRVVFDIETLGVAPDALDDKQREYLLKFASTDQEREEALQKLSLYPFTAQILAIAMVNPETRQGRVFYQAPGDVSWKSDDALVEYVPSDERAILEGFWNTVNRYDQFITFNGRSFDCPFLLLRSAVLGVRATKNLMPYRYSFAEHCDLLDQLTFHGAFRKFSLDFYCKAFGIKSPKSEGITGTDMGSLFGEERYRDIARYCLGDVYATAELYDRWRSTIAFDK